MSLPRLPLFMDTDNALGSPFGDIDDAFAMVAVLKSGHPIFGISSVFGNTFESWAFQNNQELAKLCHYEGRLFRGASHHWSQKSEASLILSNQTDPLRVLALGPLTNVALALELNQHLAQTVKEVIFTGSNFHWALPTTRFFDFNFWKDPASAKKVFGSQLALTCVPCDVARNLRISKLELECWNTELGEFIRMKSKRWFFRSLFLKGARTVPVWDLVAAVYTLAPELFEVDEVAATIDRKGGIRYQSPGRKIKVVKSFESKRIWDFFFSMVC